MDPPSSPSAVRSPSSVPVSSATDGVVDGRFFSTKKISVFLDDSNYLLWRQQVLLAVKTYKLQSFLDSRMTPPTQFLFDDSGALYENPDFARFEQQDSTLASWLLSSISQPILPHLIGMDTSVQIWNAFLNLYGRQTTSRLMSYRRALHSQRKSDLSMKEFLMKIKGCWDYLARCGEIISEQEHVPAILNGLSPEYKSMIAIITASQVPYTVQGVATMLVDAEARQQVVLGDTSSSANVVTDQSAERTGSTGNVPSYCPSSAYQGRGRGRSSTSRIQCQLCGKPGHLVDRCYH
ncbi:hypothetical protein Gohar_003274, partial [Gossypium harknessii]|nr:hypothetical protein [Gossypium harknessii]